MTRPTLDCTCGNLPDSHNVHANGQPVGMQLLWGRRIPQQPPPAPSASEAYLTTPFLPHACKSHPTPQGIRQTLALRTNLQPTADDYANPPQAAARQTGRGASERLLPSLPPWLLHSAAQPRNLAAASFRRQPITMSR